uniref:Small ribosomal subunit protein uS3c n=1 Tax=Trachelomonas grandis TaxID=215769 RepID=A0A385UK16_9EUGL|nr:ribosomal protein S3 [Trachelomonas grandis]
MGQKIHPVGFRIGIYQEPSAIWYSKDKSYAFFVKQDIFIRDFFKKNLVNINFYKLNISRKLNFIFIQISTIKSSTVFLNENKISFLRSKLMEQLKLNFNKQITDIIINILQINNINKDAEVLAEFAKQQIQKRTPFRRVMKSIILKAKKESIQGIKIQISGRLNGAEIARTEWSRDGRVPLHTLTAEINYAFSTAQTIYGIIGIKIWIFH